MTEYQYRTQVDDDWLDLEDFHLYQYTGHVEFREKPAVCGAGIQLKELNENGGTFKKCRMDAGHLAKHAWWTDDNSVRLTWTS